MDETSDEARGSDAAILASCLLEAIRLWLDFGVAPIRQGDVQLVLMVTHTSATQSSRTMGALGYKDEPGDGIWDTPPAALVAILNDMQEMIYATAEAHGLEEIHLPDFGQPGQG